MKFQNFPLSSSEITCFFINQTVSTLPLETKKRAIPEDRPLIESLVRKLLVRATGVGVILSFNVDPFSHIDE